MANMQRPLGPISDYVAQYLPPDLSADPQLVLAKWNSLESGLTAPFIGRVMAGPERDLARLDLCMLEMALAHSSIAVPRRLSSLVEEFSGGELPMLSYWLLVGVNPRADMRTFTAGAIGETEAGFYMAHKVIEESLSRTLAMLDAARELCLAGNTDAAAEALSGIYEEASSLIFYTGRLGRMPDGHFAGFRRFLASHPTRGLYGPSGLYSGTIPQLDIEARGGLPVNYRNRVLANLPYNPPADRSGIRVRLERATLGESSWHVMRKSPALATVLAQLATGMDQWRKRHLGAVMAQIPEARTGAATGTGGQSDIARFLREVIDELATFQADP